LPVGLQLPFEHPPGEALAINPGQGVSPGLDLLADHASAGFLRRREPTRPQGLDQRRLACAGAAGDHEEAVLVCGHEMSRRRIFSEKERMRQTPRTGDDAENQGEGGEEKERKGKERKGKERKGKWRFLLPGTSEPRLPGLTDRA